MATGVKGVKTGMKPLTNRQRKFVEEYLVDHNATQAAIRAGYRPSAAKVAGCQNLTKLNIAEAIQKAFAETAKEAKADAVTTLKEIVLLATSDMRDFVRYDNGGVKLIPLKDLKPGASRCIKEVSETSFKGERTITFKLHDKVKPLDMLARHFGLYVAADGATLAQGALALDAFREMVKAANTVVIPPAIGRGNGHA